MSSDAKARFRSAYVCDVVQLAQFPSAIGRFGLNGAIKLFVSRRKLRRVLPAWTERVHVRGYPFPFHFRHATTDKYIIVEVLLSGQYECLLGARDVHTIIDAGANIGTTSVFLLNAYPDATVIALEPDPGNFAVLARNLSYYGARAIPLQQALWHRSEPLVLDRGHFRDGGEWSFQVKSTGSSDRPEVEGLTLDELVNAFNLDTVDILKIDIEGAERHVFGPSRPASLDRVTTIAIELHDTESRQAFFRAVAPFEGQITQLGEVTLWRRSEMTA
jgi:FkbM family methyltransferase